MYIQKTIILLYIKSEEQINSTKNHDTVHGAEDEGRIRQCDEIQ